MDKRSPIKVVGGDDEMRSALAKELRARGHIVVAQSDLDSNKGTANSREFLELPSDLSLAETIATYLSKRTSQEWSIGPENCTSLAIALQEALVNAIRHGNHSDPAKRVRVTMSLSEDEASFTVEDEGDGFNVSDIPHPREPDNLFKSSGRGVFLIRSIMDETYYNSLGNVVTMELKRASLLKSIQ